MRYSVVITYSENGIDHDGKDKPICPAGMFNKLMEKLCGVHSDIKLLFITKETATLKFLVIVREEVRNYLEKYSEPKTSEDFYYFVKLIEQLKNSVDIIWDKIKPKVIDRLFDEFKSVYNNNRENLDFLKLVDAGQYARIENLDDYQQKIVSSAGYRKYCSQTLWNSTLFFEHKINLDDDITNGKYYKR